MNSGDTAFMLISTALVLFMTPGLIFFYGGMVQRKNVINTMMSSLFIMGLASVMWVVFGYTLSFGGDVGGLGIIGDLKNIVLLGVTGNDLSTYAPSIPTYVFIAFQMMFAIITPALITGSVIGRMRFKAIFIFIALWSIVVYYPLAHMVWGAGGFIGTVLGAVDFAGGNVVHISSGISGLVLAIILGKRKGFREVNYRMHNVPFIVLGGAILWFGWFGFNSGSALAANGLAGHAFMTTNTAAACAMLSWMLIDRIIHKKVTATGAITGAVIGLVAITPGAGFVPLWSAIIIGLLVSPVSYFVMSVIKRKFGYDDSLDAFGCHGIGGIFGGLMTGVFASHSVNTYPKWQGLIYGDYHLFVAQLEAIGITIVIAVVGTLICAGIVRIFTPLRVSEYDEKIGMDISQHGESAYPSFNGMD